MARPTIITGMILEELVHLVTRNFYRVRIVRVMANLALLFGVGLGVGVRVGVGFGVGVRVGVGFGVGVRDGVGLGVRVGFGVGVFRHGPS